MNEFSNNDIKNYFYYHRFSGETRVHAIMN